MYRYVNIIKFLILTLSLFEPIWCNGETKGPAVVMRGKTTADATITVKWPTTSVTFTGNEIENLLHLEDGDLLLKENTFSKHSGLPVVYWDSRDDDGTELHRLHLSAELRANQMLVTLRDNLTGRLIEKKVPATSTMTSATNTIETKFQLQNNLLMLPGTGAVDLEDVLKGGTWKSADFIYDGYEGVLEWQCERPSSSTKPHQASCYCSGTDNELETPSCWGFRRDAIVAFRKGSDNSVELIVFETNFSTVNEDIGDYLPNMMTKPYITPIARSFVLRPLRSHTPK